MNESENAPKRRETIAWFVVLIAMLLGMFASIELLINHISLKVTGEMTGSCDFGESFNCGGVLTSDQSTFLGQPVPVWSLCYFVGLFVITLRAGRQRGKLDPYWQTLVLCLTAGLAYSLYLLQVMIFDIGIYCPYCLLTDFSSALALTAGLVAAWPGLAKFYGTAIKSIPRLAFGPSGMSFAFAFAVVGVAGVLYTNAKLNVDDDITLDSAYELVEGYPNIRRVTVDGYDSAPRLGPEEAPIVIVEFGDFECPFCARLSHTLQGVAERYPDQVQVRFMHYPLQTDCNSHIGRNLHAQACGAARATICADEQGEFWGMHDRIFELLENDVDLEPTHFGEFALQLQLDPDEFDFCMSEQESFDTLVANVDAGYDAASAAGSPSGGTPFFFLNGMMVRGAKPSHQIETLILRELQELETSNTPSP